MPGKNSSVCSILGCNNKKQQKLRKNQFFYRFPQNKDVVMKWVAATNRKNLMAKADLQDADYFYKKRYVVCSDHFEMKCFRNKHILSKGLIKDAIPTKNLERRKSIESIETPMEVYDIKVKVEQHMCHGCLSADRRASPLGHLSDMFSTLVGSSDIEIANVYFCWECMAILQRFYKFQQQVKHAQNMLSQMQYQFDSSYTSLSTLSITQRDYYDKEIQHADITLNTDVFIRKDDPNPIKEEIIKEKRNKNDWNVVKSNAEGEAHDELIESDRDFDYDEPTADESYTDNKMHISNVTDEIKSQKVYKISKRKNKSQISWKMEYKSYAIVTRQAEWKKPLSQYYTKVYLDEAEIEDSFLKKDRKRAGDKMHFKCKTCTLIYARRIDLDRHVNLNHHKPDTPYKCLHCKKTQPSLDSLRTHWRTHSMFYKCNMCASNVFQCSMALHLNRSHSYLYACTNCKSEFTSLLAFFEHYNKNHPFVCDYCNKKCAMRPVLEKHIKNHHIPQSCVECSLTFPSYQRYTKHCRERHPDAINLKNDPELNYCVECDRQFPSRALYMKHATTKHVVKIPKAKRVAWPVPECTKMFMKRCDMLLHYNYAHIKVTQFHCDLCDKYFLKSFGLRTHMESVHLKLPKPKDKVCDLCGRAFQTNATLANHRRTHTGERPFKCTHCPAAFAQKGAMKIHQRKQHGVG